MTMVDRGHERANEESRAEVADLVAALTRPQLVADLGEGWSALSHLAHLGFWDRWQARALAFDLGGHVESGKRLPPRRRGPRERGPLVLLGRDPDGRCATDGPGGGSRR